VRGIPHAFVVDRNNRIVFSGHPMDGGFDAAVRAALAAPGAGAPPAPATQRKEVPPPIRATREELAAMSVADLKSTPISPPTPCAITTAGPMRRC
jgi:hypothetical protein